MTREDLLKYKQMEQLLKGGGARLRPMDQLSDMATQLFSGFGGGFGALLAPYVLEPLKSLTVAAIGDMSNVPLSAIPSERSNDRAMFYQMRRDYISGATELRQSINKGIADKVTRGLFLSLNPEYRNKSEQEINAEIGKAGWGWLSGFIGKLGITDKGVSDISSAIARRQDIFSATAGERDLEKARKYLSGITEELILGKKEGSTYKGGLFDDIYKKGRYGSLSFNDVGFLASKLIEQGGLDSIGNDKAKNTQAINNLKRKLEGYGDAFESLKTVFDGDLPKVLKQANALSGGSVLSMSTMQIKQMSERLEHMALVTGIRGGDKLGAFKTLTDTFYTQGVAAAGGNEAFARNAAAYYSYNLVGGRDVYGVSQAKYEKMMASMAGQVAATGKNRAIAAAYQAFLGGKQDSPEQQEAFKKLLNGDISNANLKAVFNRFNKTGLSWGDSLNHWGLDRLSDSTFVTEMALSGGDNYLRQLSKELPNKIAGALGIKAEDLGKYGIDVTKGPDALYEAINGLGGNFSSAQKGAALRALRAIGLSASVVTGGTERESLKAVFDISRADQLRNRKLDKKRQGVNLPGDTMVENIFALLQKRPDANLGEIAVAALKGIDASAYQQTDMSTVMEAAQKAKERLQKEKKKREAADGKKPKTDSTAGGKGDKDEPTPSQGTPSSPNDDNLATNVREIKDILYTVAPLLITKNKMG